MDVRKKASEALKNPKVQKSLIAAAAYAAGSQGGPAAGKAVKSYGPYLLDALAKLLGG